MAEIAIPLVIAGLSVAARQIYREAREARETREGVQRRAEDQARWSIAGERSGREDRGVSDRTRRSFGRLSIKVSPECRESRKATTTTPATTNSVLPSPSGSGGRGDVSVESSAAPDSTSSLVAIPPMPRVVSMSDASNRSSDVSMSGMSNREKKVRLLDRIPNHLRRYTAPGIENMTEKDFLDEKCPICLSKLGSPSEEVPREAETRREEDYDVLLLPCSHAMHERCIDQWLSSHITCPVCKQDLEKLMQEREESFIRAHDSQLGPRRQRHESFTSRVRQKVQRLRSVGPREERPAAPHRRSRSRVLFRRVTL